MSFLLRIVTDARFALRLLARRPAFAATLLGVLVVGIGATTAMFSVVVSLLVRPLPYPNSEELTRIMTVQPQVDPSPASPADFLDWKAGATTFDSIAAVAYGALSLSSDGETPESLPGAAVSGEFFSMLRIAPLRGRLLGPDDDRVGGPRVVVLSAAVWHRRFASDPAIIGKSIDLGAQQYSVVGIAPEGFRFAGPSSDGCDVWTPLAVTEDNWAKVGLERDNHFLDVMGRRKPGVSVAQGEAQLVGISARLAQTFPDSNTNVTVRAQDLHEALVGSTRQGVGVLFAAVGLVFLVVCANVANLLLARAAARRSEMAVRAAVGATRGRLVTQLVTETVVVFVFAALGGTILAYYLVALLGRQVISGASALTIVLSVDGTSLGFAIGIALICGIVFGLVPAAEGYRVEPQAVLAETGARASLGRSARIIRAGLVIAQVALAFALLVGSGLAVRAFAKLAATPVGFDPDGLASATVVLPQKKYAGDAELAAFYRDVLARVAAEPGVTSTALNTSIPMGSSNESGSFEIEGRPPWPAGSRPLIDRNTISPGYFRTMQIPLLRGRDFSESDVAGGQHVMIISAEAAARFFPGDDPIGRRIDWGSSDVDPGEHDWREIIGVVGDVHRFGRRALSSPEGYVPFTQHSRPWTTIIARTDRVPSLLVRLPAIVADVDPQQAVASRRSMRERITLAIGAQRFTAELLAAFAVVGLLLATLGIFGLVSYTTTQRTRELGIRLALGSSPAGVVSLVMREGVRLLGAGLAVGAVSALLVGRAVADRVPGALAFDPALVAVVCVAVGLTGTLASLLPALRAVRIPPAASLRYE